MAPTLASRKATVLTVMPPPNGPGSWHVLSLRVTQKGFDPKQEGAGGPQIFCPLLLLPTPPSAASWKVVLGEAG